MMKTSNWSLVGYGLGLSFFIVSIMRYWILYPDLDKMFAYGVIGILIGGVSWLYNKQLQHSNQLIAMGDYLNDNS